MPTLLILLAGCSIVQGLLNDPKKALAEADAKLAAGDLAGATALYDEAAKKAPTNVDAASGAAYAHLLAGDTGTADKFLAAAEAGAGPRAGEIKMRRALVAMKGGDLDKVKEYATASGTPAGKLLAAEVNLADGDRDAAKALLEGVQGEAGAVGDTAKAYLDLMNDTNPLVAGLSEAQALWALGQRPIAVRSVEDLVKSYAENREDGAEQLVLWAGRAVSVGETAIATNLLDAVTVPPAGMGWRVQATRAMVLCGEGNGKECIEKLDSIQPISPADGYADARVTAAVLISEKDSDAAKRLLEGQTGDAAARALAALGDSAGATAAAADPVLKAQFTAASGG